MSYKQAALPNGGPESNCHDLLYPNVYYASSYRPNTFVLHASLCVGRKLFGDGYSGLEYDYRGLLRLYNAQGNTQKAADYSAILHQWNVLRDRIVHDAQYDGPVVQLSADDAVVCDVAVARFFSIAERATTDAAAAGS